MRNTLAIFLSLLFLCQFAIAQKLVVIEKWPNDNKKIEGFTNGNIKEGSWKFWSQKGELDSIKEYRNDSLVVKVVNEYFTHTKGLLFSKKLYGESGQLLEARAYNYNNNDSYKVAHYYKNGNKQSSGKISSNLKEGKWLFYILKEEKYKNNIKILKLEPEEISKRKKEYVWLTNNELYTPNLYKNSDWINGFVVLNLKKKEHNADTLWGKISFAKNIAGNHFYKIKIQLNSGKTIKLQASEMLSFTRGSDQYESGFFKGNYSFAFKLIDDNLSLYTNTQSSSLFEKNSINKIRGFKLMTSASNLSYYIKLPKSKKMVLFPIKSNYKSFVSFAQKYFANDQELLDLIIYKVLLPKDVIEIVTRYNKNDKRSQN